MIHGILQHRLQNETRSIIQIHRVVERSLNAFSRRSLTDVNPLVAATMRRLRWQSKQTNYSNVFAFAVPCPSFYSKR